MYDETKKVIRESIGIEIAWWNPDDLNFAAKVADRVFEAISPYLSNSNFTGCYDMDGKPINAGDIVTDPYTSPHTEKEYWNPVYKVIFEAPSYGLEHIGGGKDGGTHSFLLRNRCLRIVPNYELEWDSLDG